MRAPFMAAIFPSRKVWLRHVGRIEGGMEALRGKTVFALHPHQDQFNIPASAIVELPETLPPQRAVLAATMETALNALWDAGARPHPTDRTRHRGRRRGRISGRLYSCGHFQGADVTLVDINPGRGGIS